MRVLVFMILLLLQMDNAHVSVKIPEDCEPISVANNRIIINGTIDSRPRKFILATAHHSMLQSTVVEKSRHTITNNIFSFAGTLKKNQRVSATFDWCPDRGGDIEGILGLEHFESQRQALQLDFDAMEICTVDGDELQERIVSGKYQEVQSRFSGSVASIAISINWKTYYFELDTAYDGALMMPYSEKLPFLKERHVGWYGDIPGSEKLFFHKSVWLEGVGYNTSLSTSNCRYSRVGMQFIKAFNWIIDYRSKKVYFRKNQLAMSADDNRQYVLNISRRMLVLQHCASVNGPFQPGDIITSVDGDIITQANICDMKDRLRSATSWDKMKIEIAPRVPYTDNLKSR